MDQELAPVKNLEDAIEAILFAAGHPVKYDKLSEVLGLPSKEVKLFVEHMKEVSYPENQPGRGLVLLTFPDSCQLTTKEEYAPYIREALDIKRGGNLSNTSMEVLAVIAYNQPVTRSYIDDIRGVDSSYSVSSLLDKGLIEPVGRLEAPGRPVLYATTNKFLRVFGLSSLSELPVTESLSTAQKASDTSAEAKEKEEEPSEETPTPGAPEPQVSEES